MPLYVKDREVGELAERLATVTNTTKTEAVRRALRHELTFCENQSGLTANGQSVLDYVTRLRAGSEPGGLPADKAFIDGLYEDD